MPRINKRLRQTLWSVVGACIVGYFLYHTIQGDRGWFAMLRMQHEVTAAQETLSQLQKKREALEHRTQRMRSESLDPDLLDEKARENLNYSKPNEIVILIPPEADAAKAEIKKNDVLQRNKK